MNAVAYILYLLIAYVITVHVGLVFYKNGRLYILRLLQGDEKLTDFINRILLLGYYLLNLGYTAKTLRGWQTVYTFEEALLTALVMAGKIMVVLGSIHFFNMAVIYIISSKYYYQSPKK
jgi:hypothetical protein